jgi:hypothetical protein
MTKHSPSPFICAITPPVTAAPVNTILHGDCTTLMGGMPAESVDCAS